MILLADLKELILQNIVKPALSGIPPTVLAKVFTEPKDKHFADIEFPDFRRPQSDSAEKPTQMIRLRNVRVGYTPGSSFAKLKQGDAVWVTFLGHDIQSARIIAKAGKWKDQGEHVISASPFEENEDFSHDSSGANVPNASSTR